MIVHLLFWIGLIGTVVLVVVKPSERMALIAALLVGLLTVGLHGLVSR